MSVRLNHTIIWCRDKQRSAAFLTEVLGLAEAKPFGPFLVTNVDNDVSLDFHEIDGEISGQHYACLVGEQDFDEIFDRIQRRNIPYWADPAQTQIGKINHHDGGRGTYFQDPDGHLLEIITRPYGTG
jgi:catechol 2,3-dioxygenase-like lactoylglutathione lyase family enzyme